MSIVPLLGLLFVLFSAEAGRIDVLKQKIADEATQMQSLASAGPFKAHDNDFLVKVSKTPKKVTLSKEQQKQSTWNAVEGSSLLEAWSISNGGIRIKKDSKEVACKSVKGLDAKNSVAITYSCMVEKDSDVKGHKKAKAKAKAKAKVHQEDMSSKGPAWDVKTGYDADPKATPYDDKDDGDTWDPRVRFWHRCGGGPSNGLSLCDRHNYIAADAMGYYGCEYLTRDGYCVQSYRHEWMEFNPGDLPFVFNPPSPCGETDKPCADH